MKEYDLLILGGGPGGCAGALRAAKLGKRIAVIEKRSLGGVCLNLGCIPTKTLLRSSALYNSRKDWEDLGIIAERTGFSEEKLYARKDEIVNKLGVGMAASLKRAGVDKIEGEGRLLNSHEIEIKDTGEILKGEYLLIATGASPFIPDIKGIENALSSEEVLAAPVGSGDVCIIGGGVIGVELATYFAGSGRRVTIIEAADRILLNFSKELADRLSLSLKKSGINVIASAKVTEARKNELVYEKGGETHALKCETIIAAIGRRANIEGIGLDCIKTDGGYINTDKDFRVIKKENSENSRYAAHEDGNSENYGGNARRTLSDDNYDKVYACGDVNGKTQLAHYAAASAVVAVENMFGAEKTYDMQIVPYCVYSSPELAAVGDCREGLKSVKHMTGGNGKMLINGSNPGFIKLYSNDKGQICGAELFCDGASELIGELALAVKCRLSVKEAASVIHAHPSAYEAVGDALRDLAGL